MVIKQEKTKVKYLLIVVILAVILIGGILAYQYWWTPKEEAKGPEGVDRETPEQVVSQFYRCYLEEGRPFKTAVERCNGLEESYKQDLLKKELVLVDPILWAQDVPPVDNFQVGNATIQGNTASLTVTFLPIWPDHKLRVLLSLINKEWKISNIEDISWRIYTNF